MKKFVAILEQEGGCDYTIGCGTKEITIEAEDYREASIKLKSIILENYTGEQELSYAKLYEISATYEIDVQLWYKDYKEVERQKKLIALQEQDLAEFQRLKQKYNL